MLVILESNYKVTIMKQLLYLAYLPETIMNLRSNSTGLNISMRSLKESSEDKEKIGI